MSRSKITVTAAAATLALGLAPLITTTTATASSEAIPSIERQFADVRINESSGLALSNVHSRVVYTHNDSGGGAQFFAVGADGRTDGVFQVSGAKSRDWEDMSTGPNNTLWIGDIGDNAEARTTIEAYRVDEPQQLRDQTLPATRYTFAYRDGRHDAEALLVRPRTGRVYVASKERTGAALYVAPKVLSTTRVNRLSRVRSVPVQVTAGAFAPKGGGFVLRNHNWAWTYDTVHAEPTAIRLPDMPQGESIEFTDSGSSLLAGSERRSSLVWDVPTP